MISLPSVKDIMSATKFSIKPDMSVYDALDLLINKNLSGVPVIDEHDVLVGIFTEKDCIRLQSTSHQYNMTGRNVADIMSSIQEALHPDKDLLAAASAFLRCSFSTLPVMQGDRLVGSLTRQQVIHGINKMHTERGQEFKSEKANQEMVNNPNSIEQMQMLVGKSSNEQLASVFGKRHSND